MNPEQTVGEAFDRMKELHIENIPVVKEGIPVGAVSESGLFNIILSNGADIRHKKIQEIIEAPYPVVSYDTPVERISSLISKENGAVLAKDDSGNFHIVTKYDVLQSFTKIVANPLLVTIPCYNSCMKFKVRYFEIFVNLRCIR